MSATSRLQALVEAEHAAVYGYAVLGARLDDAGRRFARLAYDGHRVRRDQLLAALHGLGADAPVPLPAYDVAVADPVQAMALAVRLEEGLSVCWRDLVAATDARSLRALGVAGLQETAVRAAQWRLRAGTTPVTAALPGSA